MPYGETYYLTNIEKRRKQRQAERDENLAKMQTTLKNAQSSAFIYGYIVAGVLFVAALIMYWLVSPFAGLFVLILSAVVHVSSMTLWLHDNIVVTQINHTQGDLLAMELFDDLQERIARQAKHEDSSL